MTPSPKLVRQTWANVYPNKTEVQHPDRETANYAAYLLAKTGYSPRQAVRRRDFYEDGSVRAVLEDV